MTIDAKGKFDDFKRVGELLRGKDTTLEAYDHHIYFNKKDITSKAGEMAEDYLKQEFGHLGWQLASTLVENSQSEAP